MSFLLKIWNLVPVWSSGMVPHCQECICSYGPDRKSDASILPPMWTQEGGLPAFTYLGQICKACFACQSLCLFELFFFLLCPNSFLSKQSERNKSLKQFFFFFFFFKADCICSVGVPFWDQMLGKIVKMDKGQVVVIVVSCLLFEDKLFYRLRKTVLNPVSMDSGTS